MKVYAPGSVFISGEYLILDGEPALVSAVDRYATAEFSDGKGYRVEGLSNNMDMGLPFAVCEVLAKPRKVLAKIETSVTGFGEGQEGGKFGLSSSAASCVALVRLLEPNLAESELLLAAGRAHRHFQNGKGSNADVQLAVFGGTSIVYAQDFSTKARSEHVDFPDDLRCAVVWMEASAKTVSFISKFESAKGTDGFEALHTQMLENNKIVIEAFKAGRTNDFLEALSDQDDLLDLLGKMIEAPIRVEAHNDLKKVCGKGFVAKVSGSGGGDISLVFGRSDADWLSLYSRLPHHVKVLEIAVNAKIDGKKSQ